MFFRRFFLHKAEFITVIIRFILEQRGDDKKRQHFFWMVISDDCDLHQCHSCGGIIYGGQWFSAFLYLVLHLPSFTKSCPLSIRRATSPAVLTCSDFLH